MGASAPTPSFPNELCAPELSEYRLNKVQQVEHNTGAHALALVNPTALSVAQACVTLDDCYQPSLCFGLHLQS